MDDPAGNYHSDMLRIGRLALQNHWLLSHDNIWNPMPAPDKGRVLPASFSTHPLAFQFSHVSFNRDGILVMQSRKGARKSTQMMMNTGPVIMWSAPPAACCRPGGATLMASLKAQSTGGLLSLAQIGRMC